MPRKCCIPNCKVQSDDPRGRNLSFFTAPTDEKTRTKWTETLLKLGVELKTYTYVCTLHFESNCFYYSGLCKVIRLKKGSYPTIFSNYDDTSRLFNKDEEYGAISTDYEKSPDLKLSDRNGATNLDHCSAFEKNSAESNHESYEHKSVAYDVEVECTKLIDSVQTTHSELEDPASQSDIEKIQPTPESKCNLSVCSKNNLADDADSNKKKRKLFTNISLANIDLDSIDYSNKLILKEILRKGQKEVKMLRRNNRTLQMKVSRCKKGVKNIDSLIRHVRGRKYINEKISEVLADTVSPQASNIFSRLLYRPKTKTPFPNALKSFATTLHFYSPKAYQYVRNCFMKSLPHPNTISKWHQKINCSSGINKISIDAIKIKADFMKSENKNNPVLCNLVMDEMKVRKQIDIINGDEYGYIDVGKGVNDDTTPEAENVLVVMLVCVNGNWKIPVSFYFINSLTGFEKARIVKENLIQLYKTGVTVTSLTFDGLQSNINMCNELGATLSNDFSKEIFFTHPISQKPVYIIYDGCHCLKLVRNSFSTENFYDADGNIISWAFLELLVDFQEKNDVHPGTKIRRQHIDYEQNKMNVKLAAQTLSESVSTALKYLKDDENIQEFKNCDGTARFCSIMNDAFNILNSRELYHKNKSKEGISSKNIKKIQEKVRYIIEYIKSLKLENGTLIINSRKKTGFVGMIVSTYGGYLLTYKLSQDHLENYFSAVRSKGGHNNNPTCFQFIHIFKKLLIHADVKESENANCMSLDDTTILKVSPKDYVDFDENINSLDDSPIILPAPISTNDVNFYGVGTNKTYIDNVVSYLAGFVTRQIIKKNKCYVCPVLLTSDTSHSTLLSRKNRGGLISPCKDVIEICKHVEHLYRQFYVSKRGMYKNLLNLTRHNIPQTLLQIQHSNDPLKHRFQLIDKIVSTYLRIRIHHHKLQKKHSTKKIRRIYTKLILFRNE